MASLAIPALRPVGAKLTGNITPTNPWRPARQCACASGGHVGELSALAPEAEAEQAVVSEVKPRFRWDAFGSDLTGPQHRAFRGLSPKLPNRCKALVARVVCLSPGDERLGALLAYWVKAMKPKRADWLLVLKELKAMESPLLAEVSDGEQIPCLSSARNSELLNRRVLLLFRPSPARWLPELRTTHARAILECTRFWCSCSLRFLDSVFTEN